MRRSIAFTAVTAASLMLPQLGVAQSGDADETAWTLTPGVTYWDFDTDRDVEDGVGGRLGFGREFNRHWTAEFVGGLADSETDAGDDDFDVRRYQLDALYHFGTGALQPYAVAGVGHADFDSDATGNRDGTTLNGGLGLRYHFTDNLSLRGDVRRYHSLNGSRNDNVAMLGLVARFGVSGGEEEMMAQTEMAEPEDSDGDGVVNADDQCPGTPSGVEVDSDGCPVDGDNDGVPDYQDACLETPDGAKVDDVGCQIMLEKVVKMTMDIEFPFDSADIPEEYYSEIREAADFMEKYPSTKTEIAGHADAIGPADYNKELSQRRAESVVDLLVSEFGIERSRLTPRGYGESRPIASNDTKAGRAENRRVVATIRATEQRRLRKDDE